MLLMDGSVDMNAEGEYHNMGAFVALADVAHGTGSNWLKRGTVAGAFGNRIDHVVDSDDSVATSLFVEVNIHLNIVVRREIARRAASIWRAVRRPRSVDLR